MGPRRRQLTPPGESAEKELSYKPFPTPAPPPPAFCASPGLVPSMNLSKDRASVTLPVSNGNYAPQCLQLGGGGLGYGDWSLVLFNRSDRLTFDPSTVPRQLKTQFIHRDPTERVLFLVQEKETFIRPARPHSESLTLDFAFLVIFQQLNQPSMKGSTLAAHVTRSA